MFTLLKCFVVLLVVFSCNQQKSKESLVSKEQAVYDMAAPLESEAQVAFSPPQVMDGFNANAVQSYFPGEKKIIYEGEMDVKSKEISKTKTYIDDVLTKNQAYYEKEDLEDDSFKIAYNLKLRIPFKNFKKLLAELEKGKFKITKKSIEANDVTEEFTDVSIRLENKKAYLERYKKLLNNAASIKSIIEIEEIIRALEEEIESSEGRLRYLGDQTAYSTLDIFLTQDKEFIEPVKYKKGLGEKAIESFVSGWDSILSFLLKLLSIWPYLLMLWGFYFLGKKMWKKYVK